MAKLKETKSKRLWKGIFSFPHELRIEYGQAYSEKQAKAQMLRRIAKKHGVPYGYVFNMFDKDNYQIQEEKPCKSEL
jgi:hypothetical protein